MPKNITIAERIADVRTYVERWRASDETVALVPTMGALHDGHLSLVRMAKEKADRVVVSIFVNPSQFAPNEDFDSYPREREKDLEKLSGLGVDLVFAPPREEVYPQGFATRVIVEGLTEGLCGASRPHFFGGVATVVAKLLNQCRAHYAIFGEKDYQQLLVIRRMARDLDIDTQILGGAIVREPDGLAMSSRNAYLSPEEREIAPLLHETLSQAATALASGTKTEAVIPEGLETLSRAGFRVDYFEVRDGETLQPVKDEADSAARVFGAVFLGKTRLIDNVPLPGS